MSHETGEEHDDVLVMTDGVSVVIEVDLCWLIAS